MGRGAFVRNDVSKIMDNFELRRSRRCNPAPIAISTECSMALQNSRFSGCTEALLRPSAVPARPAVQYFSLNTNWPVGCAYQRHRSRPTSGPAYLQTKGAVFLCNFTDVICEENMGSVPGYFVITSSKTALLLMEVFRQRPGNLRPQVLENPHWSNNAFARA
jgi:hypothetical protein